MADQTSDHKLCFHSKSSFSYWKNERFNEILIVLPGVVLGSFYYGYVALQIPGGWLAVKLGGTRLFGLAVLIASILTTLTPLVARISVLLLIAVRVGEGLVLVSIKMLSSLTLIAKKNRINCFGRAVRPATSVLPSSLIWK